MKKHGGIIAALASAFIFGFTPILGRLSYDGGSNGITLSFLRQAFGIPLLYILLKIQRVPLGISRQELKDLLKIGIVGPAATTLLLYASYQFIPVGIATTLHFLYPVVVALAEVLFFKSKIGPLKGAALALSAVGVLLFFEKGASEGAVVGIILALLSSVSYTIYMVGVERTSLRHMHYFKLSLYFCIVSFFVSGTFGLLSGQLTFQLTGLAWFYTFLVAAFVSVGAITLLQLGVKLVGASTTAILSTLEPITSVLLGVSLLSERMTWVKGIGCVLILLGVVLVTRVAQSQSAES